MNDAPTKKHEHDVGSKTSIRIFYPESAPRKDRDYAPGNWLFLMMAFKSLDLQWLETMAKGKSLVCIIIQAYCVHLPLCIDISAHSNK